MKQSVAADPGSFSDQTSASTPINADGLPPGLPPSVSLGARTDAGFTWFSDVSPITRNSETSPPPDSRS